MINRLRKHWNLVIFYEYGDVHVMSRPNSEITRITNRYIANWTYDQSSEQLFLIRWQFSFLMLYLLLH